MGFLFFSFVILSLFASSVVVDGARPELVSSSVWYSNQTVLNVDLDVAVVRMEFDQPLYANGQTFLCASVDQSCPPVGCTPCDWSGQQPSGCEDPSCCGPAQNGDIEQAKAWCDTQNLSPYESLILNETSKNYTLNEGEWQHFRFFLPEEYYCRPLVVVIRPFYGSVTLVLSNTNPQPDLSTDQGWKQGRPYTTFGYGQSFVQICPVIHPEYNLGTYSLSVFAIISTSFVVDVHVSSQTYPLPDPPLRILCADIPDEEYEYAGLGGDPVVCLEDGVSREVNFQNANPESGLLQFLTAVPQGCHTYSLSITGFGINPNVDLYCLPTQNGIAPAFGNVLLGRTRVSRDESILFSACFDDEVTYILCAGRTQDPDIQWRVAFSTLSETVRTKLTEVPHASLSYQDGLQSVTGVIFDQGHFACLDFYVPCFQWVVTPSTDPLYLYPPASLLYLYDTTQDLQQMYLDSGLSTIEENTLVAVIGFNIANLAPLPRDLDQVVVAVTSITNEFGDPLALPNDGHSSIPEISKNRVSSFIPHIAISTIPDYVFPECDQQKYGIYQELVNNQLLAVPEQTTLVGTQFIKYSLDIMDAAVLATTCTTEVASNLGTEEAFLVLENQTACLEVTGTPDWFGDPCCNPYLSFVLCCLPFTYNTTSEIFTDEANVSGCAIPDCAESYYEELSFSLNNVNDPDIGCTSGIENYANALSLFLVDAVQEQFISCLTEVGFGDYYQGTPCQEDSDCDHLLGICYQNRCVLHSLEEVEDQFLTCYILKMSSSEEFYLKRNILPANAINYPKTSPEFFQALKQAATVRDCVDPENPLDISHRTRYKYEASDLGCFTEKLGFQYPEELDLALAACPTSSCLGTFCQMNSTDCHDICGILFQKAVATDELCPEEPKCVPEDSVQCTGSFCLYCPPNGDLPCTEVPGITDQATCESAIACELPDGTLDFTLSESECRAMDAQCTTDCPGESCESITNIQGVCYASNVDSLASCDLYGSDNSVVTVWYQDALCILDPVSSEESCSQFPLTEWETCQENTLGECTGEPFPQRYLGCYVSLWHACEDQGECESSGSCSDRIFTLIVRSAEYPVDVQYGTCMGSGEYVSTTVPYCQPPLQRTGIGCRSPTIEKEEDCDPLTEPFVFWLWVEPALTEEACLEKVQARYGCQAVDRPEDTLNWLLDEEQCNCRGGVLQNRWTWTQGIWQGGVPRALEWRSAEVKSSYVMRDSLSFVLLSEWISQSAEEKFLFSLKSEIICESESITKPVATLVCDCLSDAGGEHCYVAGEQDKEILMGFGEACEGESSFAKDPSAQVTFGPTSTTQCSLLNISIIYRNWFAAPFVAPPLSFRWQKQKNQGVVINKNGAAVGEVLGDGVVLSFSNPELIGVFEVCLRLSPDSVLNEDGVDVSSLHNHVPDFGYSNSELVFIFPVGLEENQIGIRERSSVTWWCADLDYQTIFSESGVIRLFPIFREVDYEDEENDYASDTTTALMYTLGACYCFLGFLCFVGLGLFFVLGDRSGKRNFVKLPHIATLLFLILCIFRAVFMFLYPIGRLEDEPVAYFVIFEIPTFLLFSVLVFSIYTFKRIVYKKGFFPQTKVKYILIFGWAFIWSLWLIVTLVYSESIVDGTSGESACEGRVAVTYDSVEEDTRTLAIVYQTIIIAVTIVLGSIFFYYTYKVFQSAKKMASSKQFVIVVGGVFTVAFLARTILFLIILAADFASAIYMFITLFLTEVLMIAFLLVQFNIRRFANAASFAASATKTSDLTFDDESHSTTK